jgi:MFS family permease
MLMACAPAIVTAVFPPGERGRGMGLMGTMVALGLTCGPPLGGLLLGSAGWRSIFLVNLPVGVAALAMTPRLLPPLAFARRRESFDLSGAALFTAGCAGALLFLGQIHDFSSLPPRAWALALASAACLVGFVAREAWAAEPLLDLKLFRKWEFSAAVAAAMLTFLSGFVVVLLVPFYLSQVRGLAPMPMGLVLTTTPLLMSVLAPWAGSLSDRVGYRAPTSAGLWLRTLSLGLFLAAGPRSPLVLVVAGLALLGAGNALFNPPNSSSIMGSVPPERLGVAGGIVAVARNLGMALGIAVGGAAFSAAYRLAGGTTLAAYTPQQEGAFAFGWRVAMAAGLVTCLLAQWVSSSGKTP